MSLEDVGDVEVDSFTSHNLPNNPTVFDYIYYYPLAIKKYFLRVSSHFGLYFVLSVIAVYGVNQGVGEGWVFFGAQYYLSDSPTVMNPSSTNHTSIHPGLGVSPVRLQNLLGLANVPWQLKAIYGLISDTLPIMGLHLSPYIGLAGTLGCFAAFAFSIFPNIGAIATTFLLLIINFSIASPDVMIDAAVAKRCKERPKFASDLQTLSWGSYGVGKVFAGLTAGTLYSWFGSRFLLCLCFLTSIAIVVPAARRWLPEEKEPTPHRQCFDFSRLRRSFNEPKLASIARLACIVCFASVGMGLFATFNKKEGEVALFGMFIGIFVCCSVYYFESKISSDLANVSVFIFLQGAIQPSTPIIYYWSKESEENCSGDFGSRPCFSPTFLSNISIAGSFFFVLGTALYNRFASKWTYRKIFTTTQIALVVFNILDLIWVSRWNQTLGISDKMFAVGEEIVGPLIGRLNSMPVLILAAKLCPTGVEATLFAMTMGLWNFGSTMGGYTGVGLLHLLGGVEPPEFRNIETLVIFRSLTRFLPILFIPFLIPEGSPSDEIEKQPVIKQTELMETRPQRLNSSDNDSVNSLHFGSHDLSRGLYDDIQTKHDDKNEVIGSPSSVDAFIEEETSHVENPVLKI
eukprot:g1344.t1